MVATSSAQALQAGFEGGVITLVLALFFAPVAAAHHSVAAEFDTSQRAELQGEIAQVWFHESARTVSAHGDERERHARGLGAAGR
jgi:hypothetical protein